MKSIGNEAYLDENGQLYVTRPGVPDPFDPPGTQPPPVVTATGYTYDKVPTYGWPLGIIYDNNPLQFASAATAQKMLAKCSTVFTGYRFRITLDEVKVGPYTRAAIRQIAASDAQGLVVKMNAGEMAVELFKYPDGWQAQIARTIRDAVQKRDTE